MIIFLRSLVSYNRKKKKMPKKHPLRSVFNLEWFGANRHKGFNKQNVFGAGMKRRYPAAKRQGLKRDLTRTAQNPLDPHLKASWIKWAQNPARYDILGWDTKGRAVIQPNGDVMHRKNKKKKRRVAPKPLPKRPERAVPPAVMDFFAAAAPAAPVAQRRRGGGGRGLDVPMGFFPAPPPRRQTERQRRDQALQDTINARGQGGATRFFRE